MGAQFLFGHKDGYYVYVTDVAKGRLMSPMNINDLHTVHNKQDIESSLNILQVYYNGDHGSYTLMLPSESR
jgi:hypothetical protein